MSKYLVAFIIISFLAVGSILVYSLNNFKSIKGEVVKQNLSGTKQPASNQMTQTPDQSGSENITIKPMDIKTPITELKIEDEIVGKGPAVKNGDTAEVNYLGTLLNGTKFDSSYDRNQTFSFSVGAGNVIQGWDKGLIGMQVGGKRKLTIPSDMAYGSSGQGPIPPNSPLIFEIELVSIK